MSSHVRQHKSPYFYVRKGSGFVLLENHVETGTRYKTEAEAKRAVLALNDAWRAKVAKSNPRRRNPEMDSLMAREAQLVAELTALRKEYSEAATDISYFHDQLMRQRTAIEYQHAATLRPLETKYYAAKQQADALHERILPLQRELDALRREIQKNKPQPKDGPTWDFRQTEFNPRRRNPGAAGEVEMILWARPAGQTDALYEQPIYTQGRTMEDIERVKKLAAKEGWHTFRVQKLDLSKPYNAQKEFAATIRGSRRRNPPMRLNYSGAPMLVWHDEKPSFGVDRDHVATHGKHTYIIYQHPRDGSSVFHIDRETKGMPPYPMGSRSTLTKAKEAAQQDLEGLEAARSGHPERQNPRKADQAEVQGEVLHLLVTAEIGGGRELDALAEILKSGMPLSVSDIEVAIEAAESRLEDAEYELKTDRIRENKERNRQDRDHYRKLLKAIKRLTPTRVSNPRTRSR
jgi:hypothetical protein